MKNFDWKSFKKGNVAVHCDTIEKSQNFLVEVKRNCINIGLLNVYDAYNIYKLNVCYRYNYDDRCLHYGTKDFYEEKNYKIIEWKIDDGQFTKSDLEIGMVVKLKDGDFGVVMKDFIMLEDCYYEMKDINNDLTYGTGFSFNLDIVEVYKINKPINSIQLYGTYDISPYADLIWRREGREENEEMTLEKVWEALGEALGKKIKIKED